MSQEKINLSLKLTLVRYANFVRLVTKKKTLYLLYPTQSNKTPSEQQRPWKMSNHTLKTNYSNNFVTKK